MKKNITQTKKIFSTFAPTCIKFLRRKEEEWWLLLKWPIIDPLNRFKTSLKIFLISDNVLGSKIRFCVAACWGPFLNKYCFFFCKSFRDWTRTIQILPNWRQILPNSSRPLLRSIRALPTDSHPVRSSGSSSSSQSQSLVLSLLSSSPSSPSTHNHTSFLSLSLFSRWQPNVFSKTQQKMSGEQFPIFGHFLLQFLVCTRKARQNVRRISDHAAAN